MWHLKPTLASLFNKQAYQWQNTGVRRHKHSRYAHPVYSLVTELDQVQVCRSRRQAADVQVGFAELFQACAAAVAAAAGTGRSHGVGLHTGNPLLGSVCELDLNLI